jgi:molybdopterin synthase catalytic subunit
MTCDLSISLTAQPLDTSSILLRLADPECGAQLLFLGCTRRSTEGRVTERLSYEAYLELAEAELRRIGEEAAGRWPLRKLVIVHRLGVVEVGQASVAVAAASPHRKAVMEAVPWLMDRLKETVPIWKQENYADGSTEWVHE